MSLTPADFSGFGSAEHLGRALRAALIERGWRYDVHNDRWFRRNGHAGWAPLPPREVEALVQTIIKTTIEDVSYIEVYLSDRLKDNRFIEEVITQAVGDLRVAGSVR